MKLALLFFIGHPSFANGVLYIKDQYTERFDEYKTAGVTQKCLDHTKNINDVLKEEKKVDSRKHATLNEKEIILKAVMGTVIIHGLEQSASIFDKRETLTSGSTLYQHFEILRLTELVTFDLLKQLNSGFSNIDYLTGYDDLFSFSGLSKSTFSEWFNNVFSAHKHSFIYDKIGEIDSKTKELEQKMGGYEIAFGTATKHAMTGNSIVFISTYHTWTQPTGVFIRLPDFKGRQRHIVIENPHFDENAPADRLSPYTVRAHAVIFPDATGSAAVQRNVSISITNSEPANIQMGEHSTDVHIHDHTLSPNNAHLSGLPQRQLLDKEIYSFISHVNWDNSVDTFHMVMGESNRIGMLDFARDSKNFQDFLDNLNNADEALHPNLTQHLLKMLAFINGTI